MSSPFIVIIACSSIIDWKVLAFSKVKAATVTVNWVVH
jgi:hypothetical protein